MPMLMPLSMPLLHLFLLRPLLLLPLWTLGRRGWLRLLPLRTRTHVMASSSRGKWVLTSRSQQTQLRMVAPPLSERTPQMSLLLVTWWYAKAGGGECPWRWFWRASRCWAARLSPGGSSYLPRWGNGERRHVARGLGAFLIASSPASTKVQEL